MMRTQIVLLLSLAVLALVVGVAHCGGDPTRTEKPISNELPADRWVAVKNAIIHKKPEDLKTLLARDPGLLTSPDPKTGEWTLHLAICTSNEECVNVIMNAGADPNQYDDTHTRTAFQLAVGTNKKLPVAKLLHKHGGDIEGIGCVECANPPLAIAANHADVEVVKWLIDSGADVKRNLAQGTALHWLMHNQRPHYDLNKQSKEYREAVCQTIKLLLENGADPNAQLQYGDTPLHIAMQYGFLVGAECLIEVAKDVNVNALRGGDTPLHWAVDDSVFAHRYHVADKKEMIKRDRRAVIELLVKHGADLSIKNLDSKRPVDLVSLNSQWIKELLRE